MGVPMQNHPRHEGKHNGTGAWRTEDHEGLHSSPRQHNAIVAHRWDIEQRQSGGTTTAQRLP